MPVCHPPPTYRPVKLLANTHQSEILISEMSPLPWERESVASKEADRLRLLGEPATRIQLSSATLYKGIRNSNNKGDMFLLNDKVISISIKPALVCIGVFYAKSPLLIDPESDMPQRDLRTLSS